MTFKTTLAAALATLALSLPAAAQTIGPIESQAIDLGPVAGDAYYTAEPDGYHVVATFAQRNGGAPVRVQALLAPGQRVIFSSPRNVGEAASTVEISRENDRLLVRNATVTN